MISANVWKYQIHMTGASTNPKKLILKKTWKTFFEPDPNPPKSSEGWIKSKERGLYFHTINHAIHVFFKFSFLGFVDAPVMCIWYFHTYADIIRVCCRRQWYKGSFNKLVHCERYTPVRENWYIFLKMVLLGPFSYGGWGCANFAEYTSMHTDRFFFNFVSYGYERIKANFYTLYKVE